MRFIGEFNFLQSRFLLQGEHIRLHLLLSADCRFFWLRISNLFMLGEIQLALEVGLFLKSLPLIPKAASIVAFIKRFFLVSRVLAALLEWFEIFPGVNQWINSLPVLDFLRIFRLSFQELNI